MATTDDSDLFVDTNVLIYANVVEAPQHATALAALTQARDDRRRLWISRQVLREYLVMMTRPQVFQMPPKETVIEQVRLFVERFAVADESPAVTDQLLQLLRDIPLGGKQVHDANIVATMKAYGIPSLLTHNVKDFERFRPHIGLETIR